MKTKVYYKVTYYSPGTFFAESSSKEFDTFDLSKFVSHSANVSERHGAKPYGFSVEKLELPVTLPKMGTFKVVVEPKVLETSGIYYITGEIIFSEDIVDKDKDIFKSNLENNSDGVGIVNKNSYLFHGMFSKDDFIVDKNGVVVRSGKDSDIVEYKKETKKRMKEYYSSLFANK